LAKSAVSVGKRVAFAFGCETASDIRLHYFAASDYTRNKRSGGIGKVNNSIGDKVQIMICDVKSYLIAMHYMIAFTPMSEEEVVIPGWDLIMYWDEPTITMDYDSHELHDTMHRNWTENKISNVVLSCATLPKEGEIMDTIQDFKIRFPSAEVHSITSYDCKKSISVLNKEGYSVLPHFLFSDYISLQKSVCHCIENKTLLRYFDLNEIVSFAFYINHQKFVEEPLIMSNYFRSIADITMNSLKIYYLDLLKHIDAEKWPAVYKYMKTTQVKKFGAASGGRDHSMQKSNSIDSVGSSVGTKDTSIFRTQSVSEIQISKANPSKNTGILITTEDAHTLTDGPTIFLTEDAKKIGNFYIQQSEIPKIVFQEILQKIDNNNKISVQI
jgi:hypothetical protein